jgi:Skp family chaperone for outer membrane proteins
MKKIFFLFLLTIAAPAAALELSLEENRGESGTVGYVDIDRVFKEYSGTLNAREEFLGEIRKKEESVNQRRHAVYALKADIAKLRQEREFALTLPALLATREQLNPANPPAVSTETTVPSAAASTETAVAVSTTASADTVVSSTPVPTPSSLISTSPTSSSLIPHPSSLPLPGLGIDMPGVARVPASYFKFSVSTAVPEIDAVLSAKEAELKQKEDALRLYQRQVEKELLEYESHRSEILLGRIYIALKELAIKEEVSVIVDKRNILFGHAAVDLTGKLLEKLEEEQ